MARLDVVLPALNQGWSVRRGEWEPVVRMFVKSDALMCQSGSSNPWHHSLTWAELIASDWELVQPHAAVEQSEQSIVITAPTPSITERALLYIFGGVESSYHRIFARFLVKWWNSQ